MNTNDTQELLQAINGLDERILLLKTLVAERRDRGYVPAEAEKTDTPQRLEDALAEGKLRDEAVDILGRCLGIYSDEGVPDEEEQQTAFACMFALENGRCIQFYEEDGADGRKIQYARWNKYK